MADMTCDECQDLIPELALGLLQGRERADVLAHIEHCPACQHELLLMGDVADRLIELAPSAEPPSGFETRVLAALARESGPIGQAPERLPFALGATAALGSPGLSEAPEPAEAGEDTAASTGVDLIGPAAGPAGVVPLAPSRGPGRTGRSGGARSRAEQRWFRPAAAALVAAALAVIVAVGGYALGHHNTSNHPAVASGTEPVAAELLADHRPIGQVVVSGGHYPWVSMAMGTQLGDQRVVCQLQEKDGKTVTLGSFTLKDGAGYWAAPVPATHSPVTAARLVDQAGSVIATAAISVGPVAS